MLTQRGGPAGVTVAVMVVVAQLEKDKVTHTLTTDDTFMSDPWLWISVFGSGVSHLLGSTLIERLF